MPKRLIVIKAPADFRHIANRFEAYAKEFLEVAKSMEELEIASIETTGHKSLMSSMKALRNHLASAKLGLDRVKYDKNS